jgi:hypothetical protein
MPNSWAITLAMYSLDVGYSFLAGLDGLSIARQDRFQTILLSMYALRLRNCYRSICFGHEAAYESSALPVPSLASPAQPSGNTCLLRTVDCLGR